MLLYFCKAALGQCVKQMNWNSVEVDSSLNQFTTKQPYLILGYYLNFKGKIGSKIYNKAYNAFNRMFLAIF